MKKLDVLSNNDRLDWFQNCFMQPNVSLDKWKFMPSLMQKWCLKCYTKMLITIITYE
jgi:hypothetical protein